MPGDNIIKIIFSEFNLEYHPNCTKDFLEIADGGSEFSDSLGKFCGNENNVQQILFSKQNNIVNKENMPKILYSTQSKMWVRYAEVKIKTNSTAKHIIFHAAFSTSRPTDFTQIGMGLLKALDFYMNQFHHLVAVKPILIPKVTRLTLFDTLSTLLKRQTATTVFHYKTEQLLKYQSLIFN